MWESNGAFHPPSAFDTPNRIVADFKIFSGATQAAAFDQLKLRLSAANVHQRGGS
jgi:hypothetical protein